MCRQSYEDTPYIDLEYLCTDAMNIIKLKGTMKKAILPINALGLKCLPSICKILELDEVLINCQNGTIRLIDNTSTLDVTCLEGDGFYTAQSPLMPVNTQCPWNPPDLREQFKEIAKRYFRYSKEEVYLNPLPWDRFELLIDDNRFVIATCKASASCRILKPKWNERSINEIEISNNKFKIRISKKDIKLSSISEHFSIEIPGILRKKVLEFQNYIIIDGDFLIFLDKFQPTKLRLLLRKEMLINIKSSIVQPWIFFQQPLSVANLRCKEDITISSPWIGIKGPNTVLTLSAKSSECKILKRGRLLEMRTNGWVNIGMDLSFTSQAPWRFSWERMNTLIRSHYISDQSLIKLSPKVLVPISLGIDKDYVSLTLITFNEKPHLLKITSDYLIATAQLFNKSSSIIKLLNNSVLTTILPCYLIALRLKLIKPSMTKQKRFDLFSSM